MSTPLPQSETSHSLSLLTYRLRLPRLWKVGRQMGTQSTTKTAMAAWTRPGRRGPRGQAAAQTAPSQMLWRVSALCPHPLPLCLRFPPSLASLLRCRVGPAWTQLQEGSNLILTHTKKISWDKYSPATCFISGCKAKPLRELGASGRVWGLPRQRGRTG